MKLFRTMVSLMIAVFLFLDCKEKEEAIIYKEKDFLTIVSGDVHKIEIYQYPFREGTTSVEKDDLLYSHNIHYIMEGYYQHITDVKNGSYINVEEYEDGNGNYSNLRKDGALQYTKKVVEDKKSGKYILKTYDYYNGEVYLLSSIVDSLSINDTIFIIQIENCIEKLIIHHKGFKYTESVCFDKKGNIIEEDLYKKGEREKKYFEYDSNNFIIKETNQLITKDNNMVENKTFTYKYKTDAKGNWIEQVKYNNNDNPILLTKRNIFYM